jgi:hypothetical protein
MIFWRKHNIVVKRSWAGCQWLMPVILATQEDHDSRPTQANSLRDPISKKKNSQKKDCWSGSRYRPLVHTSLLQKKKGNIKKKKNSWADLAVSFIGESACFSLIYKRNNNYVMVIVRFK